MTASLATAAGQTRAPTASDARPVAGAAAFAGEISAPVGGTSALADPDPPGAAAATEIGLMRGRIDEIDAAMIALWQERAGLSRQVGATRVAAGGTRLVLSREREILDRFRVALGADGVQFALLLLRAGRGPL